MLPLAGSYGEQSPETEFPSRKRAPTIAIHPADEVVVQNSHLQTPSASSSGRTPGRQTALQIPVIDCADVDPDNTSATTISPVFSAMRTYSASSCSTFAVHGRSSSRRLSHSSTCGAPFLLSPKALAGTIASKSIAELEALGGLNGLAQGLQTDLYAGLCEDVSSSDAGRPSLEQGIHGPHQGRVEIYGVNKIPPKKTKGILELMMLALSDKVLVLLCIVAGISLFIGVYQALFQPHLPGQPRIEWVDSLTIMAAVLIVVVTGAVNDYQKEKQFARLVKKTEDRVVEAIRSGKSTEISVFDILVGDILHVSAGSVIPADGVLVTGFSVRCDESSITGESDHITKTPLNTALSRLDIGEVAKDIDPFMISGSKVLKGMGTYLVTGVGVNSMYGRLKMDVTERTEATPLQKKLSDIADRIAVAGVTVSVLLFAVLGIEILVQLPGSDRSFVELVQMFLRVFMISISIIVVAVPEGLPLAVTLALAIGVTRMLKDNNLVRVLSACETMGNATVVCSDKTGTLTMNKMAVAAGCVGLDGSFDDLGHQGMEENPSSPDERNQPCYSGLGSSSSLVRFRSSVDPLVRDVLMQSISTNSTASEGVVDGIATFIGSSTEVALVTFARTWLGMQPLQEERANTHIVQACPFDSRRKYMATVALQANGLHRLYLKGAPEVILRKCDRVLYNATLPLTEDATLTPERYQSLLQIVESYGRLTLRTIGFAYKDIVCWPPTNTSSEDEMWEQLLTGMTFLGTLAIHDPLRPEVTNAIAQCAQAGVSVRMVTGDNIQTACAIARECGILTDAGIAMEGSQFRNLSASEMYDLLPKLQVLARSSPEDKKTLVQRLKELGETVAVTGDGTNDGPALRTADVGFSMGISGTDVAKEASSIVLMDDNFSSIVSAIEWGRSINDVVKKFLHFQLTANITAVTLTFVSSVSSGTGESIISPAQLLWINLIMDTLAALALATDPANPSVLQRAPDTKATPIISITGWKMIIGQAIYQLLVMFVLDFKGADLLKLVRSDEAATLETFVFNTFVWMQLFNLYNNRRLDNNLNIFEGLHKNVYFIVVNIIIILGQVLIVTIGGIALSTTPLSIKEWMISIFLGALCMPVAVLLRLLPDDVVAIAFGLPRAWQTWFRKRSPSTTPSNATWLSTVDHIRFELVTCTQPRSSRLRRLIRTSSRGWGWSSSGVESERGHSDNERTPLLQNRDADVIGSRRGSVCAPSVVMVGMVAGGVGGLPRVEPHHDA
ncbi:Calcium-transporting ATPase 2 [Metarhizium anisopliae]|nr:Calcium-transporting ATPase 2 [Metarhizium anisopliae]